MKKVLFIQHAAAFGGSAMSLLYTLEEIKKVSGNDFHLIVALAKWTKPMSEFYEAAGFEVVRPDVIDTYEHTQAVSYNLLNPLNIFKEFKQLLRIRKSRLNTEKLLRDVKPDIVHLNSVVLVGSAIAVKNSGIPLVWHVREHPVKGLFKLRFTLIKKLLMALPNHVIFICNADKVMWGNPSNGQLIYNFVDFKKFDPKQLRPKRIINVEIPEGDLTILFLGGVAKIKGGVYLIKAINKLMIKYPEKKIYLLFPGGIYSEPTYLVFRMAKKILPLFGRGTHSQKMQREINSSICKENFIKLPFVKEVDALLATTDVLIFPSIRPHFARPIIEAGAMMKPVIGSDLHGVKELILDHINGLLVRAKDTEGIVKCLESFLLKPEMGRQMGVKGYEIALEKFQANKNIQKVIKIYNTIS